MDILKRLQLAVAWRREFHRVRAELATYSERELAADLRLNLSDIPSIAAEAADERVAAFVRAHPGYRHAWAGSRGGAPVLARAG